MRALRERVFAARRVLSIFVVMVMFTMLFHGVVVNAAETIKREVYDGYTITYKAVNSWGNNQSVQIIITNTGVETIENWAIQYDFCGNITSIWDAKIHNADQGIIRNNSYNANIKPEQSVIFGYNLNIAEGQPSKFKMCQSRKPKKDSYSVKFSKDSVWETGFNGSIEIRNESDYPIEDWELYFDSTFQINNMWSAKIVSQKDGSYLIKGDYNFVIGPQDCIKFGFSGKADG